MSQVFDPYHCWLGISPENHRPDHYALLGLKPFENDPQAIRKAVAQRRALVRPHQSGEHADECTRLLGDLAAASECLLNPRRKAEYDDQLRQALDMGDTRSLSDMDLEIGSEVARQESEPSRSVSVTENGLCNRKTFAAGSAASAKRTDRTVGSQHGAADEQSSTTDHLSDGRTTADGDESTGTAANGSPANGPALAVSLREDLEAIATEPARRRPLIVVVLAATAIGVLLVGMLGGVAALTGMRPNESVTGVPPQNTLPQNSNDTIDPGRNDEGTPVPAVDEAASNDAQAEVADATVHVDADGPDSATLAENSSAAETSETGDASLEDPPTEPPPAQPARHPLPPADELQRLLAQIQRTQGTHDLVSRRGILDMAEDFIERSLEPSTPVPLQAAYLQAAMQLAGTRKDYVLVFSALEQLRTTFEIDDAETARLLADALGDDAGDAPETWRRFRQAEARLSDNPADATANLHLGVYYCFVRDDWGRGLPHLAGGEDTALRLLAETELTNVRTSADRLKLGDQWWDLSMTASPEHRMAQRERAASWYRLALPDLEGAEKRRIQSRLASLIAVPPAATTSELLDANSAPVEPYAEDVPDNDATESDRPAIDLTGLWKSDRGGSVFRLVDDGKIVRCEVVTSDTVKQANGVWFRDKNELLCDRWRFRFSGDPGSRDWDLGCEPEVVDEATIRIRAEVVKWNSFGREIDRKWDATLWRKME
jgi:hypothetical protein